MRTGALEKGEELGAELDRELENEDGDGNGDMKRSTSATEWEDCWSRVCYDKAEARWPQKYGINEVRCFEGMVVVNQSRMVAIRDGEEGQLTTLTVHNKSFNGGISYIIEDRHSGGKARLAPSDKIGFA
jgi:hypothetical protein